MYKKILVPLDGSDFAECSLAHVKAVATGCNVPEVILLGVLEPMVRQGELSDLFGKDWVRNVYKEANAATENYLAKIAGKLNKDVVNVQTVVLEGNAADKILDYANKNKVDLIIMSSHGSSGIARWAFGSVADKVIRHATVPVLIVAAPACRAG